MGVILVLRKLIQISYTLLLTFNATAMILIVFFVKEEYFFLCISRLPIWVSHIAALFVPVITTGISLFLKQYLSSDSIEKEIQSIEVANNAFLPSYLGYFFVALSITTPQTLLFIYFILFLFTYCSQTIYFNPIFLFFGYHFYNATTADNIRVFIISKREIRTTYALVFPRLKRINNYTFIDITNNVEDE